MSVMVESSKQTRDMSLVLSLAVAVVTVLSRSSTRSEIMDSDESLLAFILVAAVSSTPFPLYSGDVGLDLLVLNSDILLGLGMKGLVLLVKIRTLLGLARLEVLVLFKEEVGWRLGWRCR